jgi:hypothetical protein
VNSKISRPPSACARRATKKIVVLLVFWVMGLVTAFSLICPQHALAVSTDGMIPIDDNQPSIPVSLSGVLFYDKDHDNTVDVGLDFSIPWSQVELYKDNVLVKTTTTDSSGFYYFYNLVPGNYGVRNTVDGNFIPVTGRVASITNKDISELGEPDAEKDGIYNITLSSGDQAYLYNFAAQAYPMQLISKKMLLASSAGTAIVQAVPEPSTFIMLVSAGIVFGAARVYRRNSRKN